MSAGWEGGDHIVIIFFRILFLKVWVMGEGGVATRSTQLTYSQIKSVCGTICMRRSCNQGLKSVDEGEIKDPKSSIENCGSQS